jgi:hypothetical protein
MLNVHRVVVYFLPFVIISEYLPLWLNIIGMIGYIFFGIVMLCILSDVEVLGVTY